MGKSSSSTTSTVTETPLSREQLQILQDREQFFQSFTSPALEEFFRRSQDVTLDDNIRIPSVTDLVRGNAAQINEQFAFQQEQLGLGLAQRGLTGSGVEAAALAQLSAGRGRALTGAASQAIQGNVAAQNQAIQVQNQNRLAEMGISQSALARLLQLAPQPTTAAPTGTQTTTSGGSSGFGALAGAVAGGFLGGSAGIGVGGQIGGGLEGAIF